ncbi:hypothetical protein SR187_4155 [Streptococcus ruminantium]|uniref:Uncharacterized protein n=1 Tax=Streptococcus ruminantium TaxID=1917441 RepID=A0A2Z5TM53_9STRE|nr:hypothetical protein SR187_4155 [Streptococcus ruminantium]
MLDLIVSFVFLSFVRSGSFFKDIILEDSTFELLSSFLSI